MNTDSYKFLDLSIENYIGILQIKRPEKLNALGADLLQELEHFFNRFLQNVPFSTIRGFIMTGHGEKAFIAGADIAEMADFSQKEALHFSQLGQRVTTLIESLPIPTIACVNGYALGGGFEMALAHDFVFSTVNAVFGLPEVSLGLIPGFGGTQRLARILGNQRAKEIIFTGKKFKADVALSWGIVLKSFSLKEEMIEDAKKFLQTMFENSPSAIASSKSSLIEGIDLLLKKGLEIEARHFSFLFDSVEMKEGTKAFLEKRRPDFKNNQN